MGAVEKEVVGVKKVGVYFLMTYFKSHRFCQAFNEWAKFLS